jgi:hypothetical protein
MGTAKIVFTLKDLNSAKYSHGGGKIDWDGKDSIAHGVFKCKSPCPPSESHTYRWPIKALDESGEIFGRTIAENDYP